MFTTLAEITEDNSTVWIGAVGSTQWDVCPTGESMLVLPIVVMGGGNHFNKQSTLIPGTLPAEGIIINKIQQY